jgi:hypothetical protein
MSDPYTRGMAAIGGTVALLSAAAPRRFLGIFGLGEQANGAAALGWRLFAIRTATISALAAGGNTAARDVFLPVQVLDQAAWWWGYRRGELPLRTAATAATASAAIVALDVARRRAA